MGYSIKNPKTDKSLFLHRKIGRSKKYLYYFSYEIVGCVDLPPYLEVKFSSKNGHPYVKRRQETQNLNNW